MQVLLLTMFSITFSKKTHARRSLFNYTFDVCELSVALTSEHVGLCIVVVSLACSIACVVVCTYCVAADAASCCSPLALLCFADADQYQMLLLMLKLLGNATPVVMVLPLT